MRRRLRYLFIIFLFLPLVCVKTSHGDEEDVEYKSGNKDKTTSVFSILRSDVVRVWRTVIDPQCWRSNPDDRRGEILKGVDCPRRLKILDKNNPIRRCVGVLILKYRARDGDLILDVLPNKEYKYLANQSNVRKRKGSLHCEIVPVDRAKFEDIYNRMELGSIVEVEGVWVEDKNHLNWREFHPVTDLSLVKKNRN